MDSPFQSTPLREGRRLSQDTRYRVSSFQSTPLREGRLTDWIRSSGIASFQSTPLREGRQPCPVFSASRRRFNPRPCARGDHTGEIRNTRGNVSIHAPARGATASDGQVDHKAGVSIHAPARGATPTHLSFDVSVVCINDCANGSNQPCKSRGVNKAVAIIL